MAEAPLPKIRAFTSDPNYQDASNTTEAGAEARLSDGPALLQS